MKIAFITEIGGGESNLLNLAEEQMMSQYFVVVK